MILPLHTLHDVLDQTWPAAKHIPQDCWCLRLGKGGGKRVCAATLKGTFDSQSIDAAAQRMHDFGQPSLFMVRDGEHDLDAALDGCGYEICDPCNIYSTLISKLTTQTPPTVSMFNIWGAFSNSKGHLAPRGNWSNSPHNHGTRQRGQVQYFDAMGQSSRRICLCCYQQ